MRNLIKKFKEDKILRLTVYIILAITSYIVIAHLINPMIIAYTILILIVGLLVGMVGALLYIFLDTYINDKFL